MGWTSPKSWTTGYKVLASDMNTFLSDNDSALRAGGIAIASQAVGDIVYASSTTQLGRVGIGTANQLLTSSGSAPQWSSNIDIPGTLDVTGATTLDSTLVVSVAGPHSIGGAPNDYTKLTIAASFTSGGASTEMFGIHNSGTLTGHSADSDALVGTKLDNNIVTTGSSTTVAQLWVAEPQITVGAGSVTNAATVYIEGAANEATNDYALWVDDGATKLDSTLAVGGKATLSDELEVTGHTFLSGTLSIGYLNASLNKILIGGPYTSPGTSTYAQVVNMSTALTAVTGDTAWAVGINIGPSITTQASETIAHVASMVIDEPDITKGSGATITTASTLWIRSAPTEGERNAGLVAEGVVINEESPAITPIVQSSKKVGMYIGGQSNDDPSCAVVSLTDDIAGTSRNWSIVNGRTDSAQTVGTLNFLAADAISKDPLDGAVTVMALDDSGDVEVAGTMTATQYFSGASAAIAPDATTTLFASAGASGSDAGMIAVRDGYTRFGLFWYGSYNSLTKLAGNSVWSATKDNASTLNIYYESGNIVYQNKTTTDPMSISYTRLLY